VQHDGAIEPWQAGRGVEIHGAGWFLGLSLSSRASALSLSLSLTDSSGERSTEEERMMI
jgi:hypothetical protein